MPKAKQCYQCVPQGVKQAHLESDWQDLLEGRSFACQKLATFCTLLDFLQLPETNQGQGGILSPTTDAATSAVTQMTWGRMSLLAQHCSSRKAELEI